VGGSERQLAALLEGLPTERYEKHVICLSGFGAMYDRISKAADHVYDLKYPRLRKGGKLQVMRLPTAALVFPRMVWLLRKIQPDILHTLIPVCNVIGAWCAPYAKIPKLVCTRLSLGDYRDKNLLMAKLENFVDARFDLVHCKSRGIMEDVLRREPIPAERIRIVYNGLNTAPYEAAVNIAVLKESLGIPRDAPVIGSVANLHPYKGHVDLVHAVAKIGADFPEVRLLLIGRPAGAENDILAQAEKAGIADRVILLGERSDVPELLQCMDVFVLASHEEGFSNAVLEAMAARRPVVATALGGNLEQVVDGETGYLVPSKDPEAMAARLQQLLASSELARSMGEKGYQRVRETFSYEAMIAGMEQFYAETLSLGPARLTLEKL
jgi:glycosyltransferase involved in cell wall biosynthesis